MATWAILWERIASPILVSCLQLIVHVVHWTCYLLEDKLIMKDSIRHNFVLQEVAYFNLHKKFQLLFVNIRRFPTLPSGYLKIVPLGIQPNFYADQCLL